MVETVRPETALTTSSSTENLYCPHCGKEKKIFQAELLGTVFNIPVNCQCEIDRFNAAMERINRHGERERARARLKNSGLDQAEQMTLAGFQPRPGTALALQVAQDFIAQWEQKLTTGAGFTLAGAYGNGKSHLAAAVIRALAEKGIWASYQPVAALLKRVRATFSGSGETEEQILDLLQNVKCLALDDVGAQKQTAWAEEFLFTVVDHRYRRRLPTIVTTNCTTEQSLTEALGGRVVDRLVERNTFVRVTAASYRRELAKQRISTEDRGRGGIAVLNQG